MWEDSKRSGEEHHSWVVHARTRAVTIINYLSEARQIAPSKWQVDLVATRMVIDRQSGASDRLSFNRTFTLQAVEIPRSRSVSQRIAVLYRSRDGGFRQETIPPGAILIQGRQGEPLVAQRLHDLGGEIAGQDLLVGGLSALGRAGALLNEPTEEFSNSISSNSFSSNTIRRSRRLSLLPALIDGFFNTTTVRINFWISHVMWLWHCLPHGLLLTNPCRERVTGAIRGGNFGQLLLNRDRIL